jgi:opacity protein-like surface antigen
MKALVFVAAAALTGAPAAASAEGYFSPWLGVHFASEPVDFATDRDNGRGTFGISAGSMGAGVFGGEFDFGYSPRFFGDEAIFGSNNVMTAMGNLIIGIPIGGQTGGGVRPYATGGVGLIRSDIDGPFDDGAANNDFAFSLGGGVMGFLTDHFGLRGDLRYFRTLNSDLADSDLNPEFGLGDFDFWRASFGIVVR